MTYEEMKAAVEWAICEYQRTTHMCVASIESDWTDISSIHGSDAQLRKLEIVMYGPPFPSKPSP